VTLQCLFGSSASTGAQRNTIMNSSELTSELKNYFTVLNTNYAVSYYIAVICFHEIFDSMKNLPFMQI